MVKYISAPPASQNNIFIGNNNIETFGTPLDDTAILKASIWVKVIRPSVAPGTEIPVKFQGNFRVNGAFNRVSNKTTTGVNDTWGKVEFQVGMAEGQTVDNISFRINLQENGYQQYDEIYIDDVKACVNCATLGVEKISKDDASVRLYPNPVRDVLNIEAEDRNVSKIEVYSMLGKRVLSADNTKSVNVSSLSRGVYISKIFGDDSSISTKRFVKE